MAGITDFGDSHRLPSRVSPGPRAKLQLKNQKGVQEEVLVFHVSSQLFWSQGQLQDMWSFQSLESYLSALVFGAGEDIERKAPLINCWGQASIFFNKTPAPFLALANNPKSEVHGISTCAREAK